MADSIKFYFQAYLSVIVNSEYAMISVRSTGLTQRVTEKRELRPNVLNMEWENALEPKLYTQNCRHTHKEDTMEA